jgi:F420-dependent oxidoreductase-like protein
MPFVGSARTLSAPQTTSPLASEGGYIAPMRFALSTAQHKTTWERLDASWQVADELEIFESAWLFDHFYPLFTAPTEPCLEGWSALSMLLARTKRIRGALLVSAMPYRHPALLANMIATIDIASGGRLEIGLGAGWFEDECKAYGIPLGTMRERFDRFDEGLEVIDSLLTQDRTTFTGSYYQLVDALLVPKALQQPRPPICIGGQGEQRTLRAVARWADHWNAPALDAETFKRKFDVLQQHCANIGRNISDITVSNLLRSDGTDAVLAQIDQFASLGVNLFLVSVPSPHNPDDVANLGQLLASIKP